MYCGTVKSLATLNVYIRQMAVWQTPKHYRTSIQSRRADLQSIVKAPPQITANMCFRKTPWPEVEATRNTYDFKDDVAKLFSASLQAIVKESG